MSVSATKAVFLSYASQDAIAAQSLCDGLRAAGVEVWFDANELSGGDAWDRKIRSQIGECAIFLPLISAHTQARLEGYFRLEWRLAEQRTHLMAKGKRFLLPVCVDDTPQKGAQVPDAFLEVQWTRLRDGIPTPQFISLVRQILAHAEGGAPAPRHSETREAGALAPPPAPPARRPPWLAVGAVGAIVATGAAWYLFRSPPPAVPVPAAISSRPSGPAAPGPARTPAATERSVAVLAFANSSEGRELEYFSDGISEELLNVLGKIPGLRVSARTSAFSFKGRNLPVPEIARQLGVEFVVEGSVRQAAGRVRITAQLVKAADGFNVWSERYDRRLEDILAVQDEIAQLIVRALRPALGPAGGTALSDEAIKAQVQAAQRGGTRDAEAYRWYIQGRFLNEQATRDGYAQATESLRQALALDPGFALAWAELARNQMALVQAERIPKAEGYEEARTLARRALALEPGLGEAHAVLSQIGLVWDWNWLEAKREADRALELEPNHARVMRLAASVARDLGAFDRALDLYRRSAVLDPVAPLVHVGYCNALLSLGRYAEAEVACRRAIELNPGYEMGYWRLAMLRHLQGHPEEGPAIIAPLKDESLRVVTLALVLPALGRRAEADRALADLEEKYGARWAFQIAEVRAQRGEIDAAFAWLERAAREKDQGMTQLRNSPLLRPLHADPRWQPLLVRLNFANLPPR